MEYRVTRVPDDYLEHHGVKGQKWGVRRYKQYRKEGAIELKNMHEADKRAEVAVRKVKSYDRRSESVAKSIQRRKENGSATKRQTRKLKKLQSRRQKAVNDLDGNVKSFRASEKKVEALTKKASKLPIKLNDHTGAKYVAGLAAAMLFNSGTGNAFKYDSFVTNKDHFDDRVLNKRGTPSKNRTRKFIDKYANR